MAMFSTVSSSPARPTTTHILLDSRNIAHNLHRFDLQEEDIRWRDLFHFLAQKTNSEKVQISWHRPERLISPKLSLRYIWKRKCASQNPQEIKAHMADFSRLSSRERNALFMELKRAKRWLQDVKIAFSKESAYFRELQQRYPEIQIHEEGYLQIDPVERYFCKEKGVDAALSLNMAELARLPETREIVLMSGDGDYEPAAKRVKSLQKELHIVAPSQACLSKELCKMADSVKVLDKHEWFAFRVRPQNPHTIPFETFPAAA